MLPFEGPAAQGTVSVRHKEETEGTHWETRLLDKEAIYKGVAACREVTRFGSRLRARPPGRKG